MSRKKTSSLRRFDYRRLLYLLIPPVFAFILGAGTMGAADTVSVMKFLCVLYLAGIAAFPLSSYLFPASRSGGFLLSKALGILSCALIIWTLTYIRLGRFNLVFEIIVLAAVAAACWAPRKLRDPFIENIKNEGIIENIAFEEALFSLFLMILCFYKGFLPDINGQEKFMDYGFIMSMLRNSDLPANDMWLSGEPINYYYFGQFVYAMIIKLTGVYTGTSYNISMCVSIALPFAMCYSIGQMALDIARENGMRSSSKVPVIGGVLSGLAVTVFGNSHSFFYDENANGNGLLRIFEKLGADVGQTDGFFYPNSTRYIGYNPDSALIEGIRNGGDYTIEEFPFYSYLVGDLHAHVCSTMVVLLIFALAVSSIGKRAKSYGTYERISGKGGLRSNFLFELQSLLKPEIIASAMLLGIAQMTNYWDFLIYFIFCSMLLLVINTYGSRDFSTFPGALMFIAAAGMILGTYLLMAYNPALHTVFQIILFGLAVTACAIFPCALSRTSAGMSFLFASASLIALPFNLNFDMISNKLAWCVNHSPFYQLFILWGTHVIICVTFFVFTIVVKNGSSSGTASVKKSKRKSAAIPVPEYSNPVAAFFAKRNPMDVFFCGVTVVGLLLLIAPEIFYVRDIYTGGYLRSNTMFKFTYAGFIILSIAMIYSIMRLMFWRSSRDGRRYNMPAFVISIVFCFLLFIPAHYTLVSLKQRSGELRKSNYRTLDGTKYLETYTSPNNSNVTSGNLMDYDAAIRWFNEEVKGSPVILEAYGNSYTDNDIISAYTGLPTVCGWQTHEWLWRFHGIVDAESDLLVSDPGNDVWSLYLTPRHTDIDIVYTSSNPDLVRDILNKYDVSYVVIGDLERSAYGGHDNTALISSLGNIVFNTGSLMVVQVS